MAPLFCRVHNRPVNIVQFMWARGGGVSEFSVQLSGMKFTVPHLGIKYSVHIFALDSVELKR